MLREADSIGIEEFVIAPAYAAVRAQRGVDAVPVAAPPARYGEGRRLNSPAVILTILLHVALIAALFMVRNHFVHKHEAKLTVLNLMPEAPPPASQPDKPTPNPPVVAAPRPIVPTPASPVVMQTTPDPQPPQPVAAPSVAVATPGPPAAPPMAPAILEKGNIDGNILSAKMPTYPLESRRKKETGTVSLMVTIGIDGRVVGISVRKSSGFARLDDAAEDAVRKWRWKPFLENGQPAMIRGTLEFPFNLT